MTSPKSKTGSVLSKRHVLKSSKALKGSTGSSMSLTKVSMNSSDVSGKADECITSPKSTTLPGSSSPVASSGSVDSPSSQPAIPFDKIVDGIKSENVKRGPGRPRKDSVSSAGAASTSSPLSAQAPLPPPSAGTAVTPSDVPAELIGATLRSLSNIPAQKYKNPGYLIDEKQALEDGKTLKPGVDKLIDKWLPHVGPWALELSFAAAVAGIIFRQYQSGEAFRAQNAKPVQAA